MFYYVIDMEETQATAQPQGSEKLVRGFGSQVSASPIVTKGLLIAFVGALVVGGATGYIFSRRGASGSVDSADLKTEVTASVKKGDKFGSSDTKTFRDTTEGVLKEGGIEGEGQFHLERPGGKSQNVYLTSSVIDLSKLIGKKVKVWGETQKAQHAGWLMDVGRVEVL